jgi:dCTP deaminase
MILSGARIKEMVESSAIVIDPYDPNALEPNSYGFRLGPKLIEYNEQVINPRQPLPYREHVISEDGFLFQPGRFYLGHTFERIGGVTFASELFANLSTAMCGVFLQMSAPLGHTGAIINWTLEITVVHPVRLYPYMRIGKICFWQNLGEINEYSGRYAGSDTAVASKIFKDGEIL